MQVEQRLEHPSHRGSPRAVGYDQQDFFIPESSFWIGAGEELLN